MAISGGSGPAGLGCSVQRADNQVEGGIRRLANTNEQGTERRTRPPAG